MRRCFGFSRAASWLSVVRSEEAAQDWPASWSAAAAASLLNPEPYLKGLSSVSCGSGSSRESGSGQLQRE